MSQFVWTFPGGKKVLVKAAAVAGNVAVTKTVPAGKTWLLMNISFDLTTDGTAANRVCRISLRDAATAIKFQNQASLLTASLGQQYYFNQYFQSVGDIMNALGFQLLVTTEDIYLEVVNGVAGDAYDYVIEYLEIDTP